MKHLDPRLGTYVGQRMRSVTPRAEFLLHVLSSFLHSVDSCAPRFLIPSSNSLFFDVLSVRQPLYTGG